ncbi:MAG: hypothetical protein V7700_02620 [Halioglobus sp.]
MNNYQAIIALLFIAPLAAAQGSADAVNERIPVKKIELEAHWKVNCASAWSSLQAASIPAPTGNDCGVTARLRRQIQLCAYIYQAPGDNSTHRCPDYRSVSEHLQQPSATADCATLRVSIQQLMHCPANNQ